MTQPAYNQGILALQDLSDLNGSSKSFEQLGDKACSFEAVILELGAVGDLQPS